jgi:DNA-binding LacI/PurR family transcriptional regulator
MKKAITIKDVAKAAGVSIATVSYIVNEKTNQRISPETTKKVKQWINILNYVPNQAARAIVASKTMNIAFISSPDLTYLQKLELMNFLELFSKYVGEQGYRVFYIYHTRAEIIHNCDAIV